MPTAEECVTRIRQLVDRAAEDGGQVIAIAALRPVPDGFDPELTALAESFADTWDRTPPEADIRQYPAGAR